MWQPPTLETDQPLSLSELGTRWKVSPRAMDRSLEFTHRTSHRDVCFHVHVTSSRPGVELSGRWHPAGSLGEIPLANPHARMIRDLAGGV